MTDRQPIACVIHRARPVSMNDFKGKHWSKVRPMIDEWRQAGFILAKKMGIKHYDRVGFDVVPFGPGRSQDPGNCYPSAKAFIDGIVDANVIDDDDGDHVAYVTMLPFEWVAGTAGLRLTIYNEARVSCAECGGGWSKTPKRSRPAWVEDHTPECSRFR